MTLDPLDIMRGANAADALCCDTVAAWLAANGVVVNYSRRRRLAFWRRLGVEAAARTTGAALGLESIDPTTRRDGDVVLFKQPLGGATLGVARMGRCVMAAGGTIAIFAVDPARAWGLSCRK